MGDRIDLDLKFRPAHMGNTVRDLVSVHPVFPHDIGDKRWKYFVICSRFYMISCQSVRYKRLNRVSKEIPDPFLVLRTGAAIEKFTDDRHGI